MTQPHQICGSSQVGNPKTLNLIPTTKIRVWNVSMQQRLHEEASADFSLLRFLNNDDCVDSWEPGHDLFIF